MLDLVSGCRMAPLPASCIDDRTSDTILVSCSPFPQAVPHGMCHVCGLALLPIMEDPSWPVAPAIEAWIYNSYMSLLFLFQPREKQLSKPDVKFWVLPRMDVCSLGWSLCANLRCDREYVGCILCLLRQAPQMLMLFNIRKVSASLGPYHQQSNSVSDH